MESAFSHKKVYPNNTDDNSDHDNSNIFQESPKPLFPISEDSNNNQDNCFMIDNTLNGGSNRSIESDDIENRFLKTKNKGTFSSLKSVSSNHSTQSSSRSLMNHMIDASTITSVESLINFLTVHSDNICSDQNVMKKFESLTIGAINGSHESEIYRIIRANGWNGSRYKLSSNMSLNSTSFLQSLSNWYLKTKLKNESVHMICDAFEKDSKVADQIFSFCPDILLQYLRQNPNINFNSSPTTCAEVKSLSFKGACMLADISGFTKFSGSMCSKGVSGLDYLREATNGFLGHFVKIVYEFQGDVVAFAGDALICVFLDSISASTANGSLRALQCACILRNHEAQALTAHIAVSYGDMKLALLGGLKKHWIYLLNGACLSELSDCISEADSKEVVVTIDCYKQALSSVDTSNGLEPSSVIKAIPRKNSNNILIESVNLENKAVGKFGATKKSLLRSSSRLIKIQSVESAFINSTSLFIPKPIYTAISSESLDHIGELRQITTMFLSLDSYSPIDNQDPCTLQPFFLIAQEILQESGGYLRQFLVDDKGCVLIVMWGIPSYTHSNNCSRALFCAVSICKKSKEVGHRCSVGVTTGNVFCGMVGAPERRDYAGIGSDVNMAARLMAKARERILIDQNTYDNLSQDTKELFTQAEEMKLKGSDKPWKPYKYNAAVIPHIVMVDEQPGRSTILKKPVKVALSSQLDEANNCSAIPDSDSFSRMTIIIGPPGCGKSTAAEYFRHGAQKRGMQCIWIKSRRGLDGVPYGIIKELILELIGEDRFMNRSRQVETVNRLLDFIYPTSSSQHSLKLDIESSRKSLELVLGVEASGHDKFISSETIDSFDTVMDEYEKSTVSLKPIVNENKSNFSHDGPKVTRNLSRKANDNTVYNVIKGILRNIPTAIVIEDAHYCDELSWQELYLLMTGTEINLAFLITMEKKYNISNIYMTSNFAETTNSKESNSSYNNSRNNRKASVLVSAEQNMQANQNTEFSGKSFITMDDAVKHQAPAAYTSIIQMESTKIMEMTSLNEDEVRETLCQTLNVKSVSQDIVTMVMDVSSGNAFWCKAIASFIKDRGVKELERAIEKGDVSENPLKILILLRMESLKKDLQLVIKYASIIGEEFSEKMIYSVLPDRFHAILPDALKQLTEDGFLTVLEEYPVTIYGFQNKLIKDTLYALMPPSDSAHLHSAVAEFIENEYSNNLRPFYSILGDHYKKSNVKRHLAFKYKVKAADQAISRGAFNDGLNFVAKASNLAATKPELKVLIAVISRALEDLTPVSLRKNTRRPSFSKPNSDADKIEAYLQLKIDAESYLDKISREAQIHSSLSNPVPVTNRMYIKKNPSGLLNWQPSYVALKTEKEEEEMTAAALAAEDSKNCCTLS